MWQEGYRLRPLMCRKCMTCAFLYVLCARLVAITVEEKLQVLVPFLQLQQVRVFAAVLGVNCPKITVVSW